MRSESSVANRIARCSIIPQRNPGEPLFDLLTLSDFNAGLIVAAEEPGFIVGLLSQVWLWAKVAIGIGLVIFVHELGHFLAAKFFGVKCEKFYVGFDVPLQIGPIKFPRTLGKFQYGETEYGIGILPLGGYVKMLGQDDDPRNAEKEAQRIKTEQGDDDAPPQYDPRSFPAKPVWQRMIIISAGVVVNLITGILFAALAYGYGVPYTPAVVGGVSPGGPAWQAGIGPGGEVVSVAGLSSDDQLHFNEMKEAILHESMEAPETPVDVAIRYGDETKDYKLVTAPHPEEPDMRLIGITNAMATVLSPVMPVFPDTVAATAFEQNSLSDKAAGAEITAINGEAVDGGNAPASRLLNVMLTEADQDTTLKLRTAAVDGESSGGDTLTITLPPQKMRGLGIGFAAGPITAVMDGSPAAEAGVQVGDQIIEVDGSDTVDAYSLILSSYLTSRYSDAPVKLKLSRGKGDDAETIDVELKPDFSRGSMEPISQNASDIASGPLGIALRPIAIAASVPTKSSGDDVIAAGDEIREVSVVWGDDGPPEALVEQLSEVALERLADGWQMDSPSAINGFATIVQLLPLGTEFEVFGRSKLDKSVVESKFTVAETDSFWFQRGLSLMPTSNTQTASSVGQALTLGLREGGRRLGYVFRFLGLLVQGKVKAKFVGGPIRIVQMAGIQAEKGISKQLLFLTMLSMNLAILNFLPIPALDGGHMVFLTAELILGRRVDEQLEMKLTLAGVLAILSLMVFVFANDIIHS